MAPSEKHGTDMEIADRECSSGSRPRDAPLKMGVKHKAQGEDNIAQGHQLAGATIDIVVAEPHIIAQQHEGYQEIDASSKQQYRVIELMCQSCGGY